MIKKNLAESTAAAEWLRDTGLLGAVRLENGALQGICAMAGKSV